MIDEKVASRILDDARKKINDFLSEWHSVGKIDSGLQILNLSGTTDIECLGEKNRNQDNRCTKCDGTGVIKHKWKVSVTLEYGKLPETRYPQPTFKYDDKQMDLAIGYSVAQEDMLNARYRQVVE